ncbi:MAG: glycosyltransferase family 2 protein [Candidatus Eisenbacteria bacterium]|uniref:Glycosyltransferase family 2 protein n=1 Tax=Eiseniibacteriota bacterium TaxID=2212470 RepID=A0A9D6LB89_UNCEI|nr:glycosyltransferase family 2 protein [Candidatus Eisenbacteria bacterium]MBI3540242.1 glycosyltransferase family 2 protein [Candidatus Eisenbacteria bacterium]
MIPGRVLVIVPAMNEEESLPVTLDELRRKAPGVAVLVVDDGSRDATTDVARARGVPVVRHAVNLGVGAALQTGFRWALAHGFDVAVQLDADGQHDPAFLDALVEPVLAGRCDVSIGSRFVSRSAYRAPAARRFGMVLFSAVVRLTAGVRITDTTSGFRAYDRAVMEVGQHDFPKDFPDAPLLIDLARRGFRLCEVAVEMRPREAGRSFYTLGKSLYYPYKNLLASLMVLVKRAG